MPPTYPACRHAFAFAFSDTEAFSGVRRRTGSVLVNGSIGNATIALSGTGSVYLLGTNTSVGVDLAGISNVYLRNANGKHSNHPVLAMHQLAQPLLKCCTVQGQDSCSLLGP